MKKMIIILVSILVTFIVIQTVMANSTNRIEKQQYSVIRKENEFEIRYYPSATFATIRSSAKTTENFQAADSERSPDTFLATMNHLPRLP